MERNRNALYISWSFYWIVLIHSSCSDAVCEFPIALQNSEWVLKYYKPATKENRTLTFGVSGVSNWLITAQGDPLNEYTCINNTENVYVLKSNQAYSDEGEHRWIYICMKLTRISDTLFYFWLLNEEDGSVSPKERIYSPDAGSPISDTAPACDFCKYTDTQSLNSDIRVLEKFGNTDVLAGTETLCLPCDAVCLCQDLEVVEHATNETTGNEPGDSVTYTCETGYEITSGSPMRTCQNNQTWNGTAPECSAVSCPTLATVDHSSKQQTGTSYNDTVTYTCNSRYERSSGSSQRTCKNDKTWSGSQPVCTAVSCPPLATVAHSSKQQTGTSYNDTVTYTCNSGYERSSGSSQRTCKNDKKWSGSQPVCKKTENSTLSLKETNVVVGATVGGCFVLIVVAAGCIAFCVLRRKKKRKLKNSTKRKKKQRMDKDNIQFY